MTVARTPPTLRRAAALLAVAFALTIPMQDRATPPSLDQVTMMHEARLRKLHLVRPDLINFPISFDAVC